MTLCEYQVIFTKILTIIHHQNFFEQVKNPPALKCNENFGANVCTTLYD